MTRAISPAYLTTSAAVRRYENLCAYVATGEELSPSAWFAVADRLAACAMRERGERATGLIDRSEDAWARGKRQARTERSIARQLRALLGM